MAGNNKEQPADDSFVFVSYDGVKPPRDAKTRRRIKQQAMKKAAVARKETGSYGKQNLRQLPVFVSNDDYLEATPPATVCIHHDTEWKYDHLSSGEIVPANPYSRHQISLSSLRVGTCGPKNFDLLFKVMPLMGLRLGVASLPDFIHDHPCTTALSWMSKFGGRKFLSFIPSRYDQVPSLRYATDCIIAKFEQIMLPVERRTAQGNINVLLQYQRALRELQRELNSELSWISAETLCATQLLGVFETLNGSSNGELWIRHVTGAARLIEARGVHRFDSEFERSLLLSHIGPTVMASFLDNTRCFLEDGEWTTVIRCAVDDDELLTSEKALVVALWSSLIQLPALFKDATDILLHHPARSSQENTDNLIDRLFNARVNLIRWLELLRNHSQGSPDHFEKCCYGIASNVPAFGKHDPGSQFINQLALRGTYAVCRMIKSRLLFALAPARFHDLELESQGIARVISNLKVKNADDAGEQLHGHMLMAQSMWIANGIAQTKDIWDGDYALHQGTIEGWKFEAWNRAIGRRCY